MHKSTQTHLFSGNTWARVKGGGKHHELESSKAW